MAGRYGPTTRPDDLVIPTTWLLPAWSCRSSSTRPAFLLCTGPAHCLEPSRRPETSPHACTRPGSASRRTGTQAGLPTPRPPDRAGDRRDLDAGRRSACEGVPRVEAARSHSMPQPRLSHPDGATCCSTDTWAERFPIGREFPVLAKLPLRLPPEQRGPRSCVRNKPLSWSPLTESNRRPSPYHRSPAGP
jgi:hypothetical protein